MTHPDCRDHGQDCCQGSYPGGDIILTTGLDRDLLAGPVYGVNPFRPTAMLDPDIMVMGMDTFMPPLSEYCPTCGCDIEYDDNDNSDRWAWTD